MRVTPLQCFAIVNQTYGRDNRSVHGPTGKQNPAETLSNKRHRAGASPRLLLQSIFRALRPVMIINHMGMDVIHLHNAARSRRYRRGHFSGGISKVDGRTLAIAPHHVGDAGYTPSIIFRPASQSHRHKWHSAFCSDKHTPQPAVAAAALTSADIENSAARRPACPPVCLPD